MFLLKRNESDMLYGVLFDISSGSVGVSIVASHVGDRLPKILYAHRTGMRVSSLTNRKEENVRRIREALFSSALLVSQNGLQALTEHYPDAKITKLYVTCSSPWSYTVARNVHYENDESFKITEGILQDLIQSAEDEILSHLRNISVINEEGFEIVERATVDIAVNEYPVSNPLSLQGKILDLSHVIGAIPKDILIAIHEVQDKLFPNTELRAHTYMLIMYCVLRDILPTVHSLCIIDITAEATEFGIVEHNLLTENLSVPFGSGSFARHAAKTSERPIADILTQVHENNNPETSLLSETVLEYKNKIQEALTDLLSRRMIPADIVITAQKEEQAFFKKIVEEAVRQVRTTETRFIEIDSHIIDEIDMGAESDSYLALGARFFHKLHGCGEISDT